MRAQLLRRRSFARALVLAAVVVGTVAVSAAPAIASGPSTLGVSGWQVYSNTNSYVNHDGLHYHGEPGEFNDAPAIPAQDASGWADCGPNSPFRYSQYGSGYLCPNATSIGMGLGSILPGGSCFTYLGFTYFQALVSIPAGTDISTFTVNMSGADDGARISLVNSAYPNGITPPGGYIYQLTTQSTGNLADYVVPGEVNRVVITQVDDCTTGNNLHSAVISLNGNVIPPAPTDTAAPTDSPNVPSGWSNSDATVNWNWTDTGGSGIDLANCPQSSTSSGEGAIVLSSTCSDNAGNSNSDSATVYVDKTAPADAPVYPSTWTNSDATVQWNWTDGGGSGIDCDQSSTSQGEGAITLSSTCTDAAGNTSSDSVTVYVDKTAPTDAPAYSSAWTNSDATVEWNWTDAGGSGINCDQSSTSSGEGTITLTSNCSDAAGNSSSDSVTVNVDKTAPVVSYTGGGTYTVDQNVSVTCTASDSGGSGLASDSCSNVSGPAWSLGLGTHDLSASATDNAGNTGSARTSYTVTVDAASLCTLATRWAKNAGIANSLCVKLNAAAAAKARGQAKTAQNNIDAFDNEVRAQSGKGFTAAQAALLVQFAAAI